MEAAMRSECQQDCSGCGDACELKFSQRVEDHNATGSPAKSAVYSVSMPYMTSPVMV